MPACLVCGDACAVVLEKSGHSILGCPACTHRMLEPPADERRFTAEVFDDAYFESGGVGYPGYLADHDLGVARGIWYAQLAERHGVRPGRVVDLGAAAGFLLEGFRSQGFEVEGVEANDSVARHAREDRGIAVHTSRLEDFTPAQPGDLVTAVQIVAHVCRPQELAQAVRRALRPGGHVLVETWDCRSWMARAFGSRWHEYSPPVARQWFTRRSLDTLFRGIGLEPVALGRPRKRIRCRHALELASDRFEGSWVRWPVRTALSALPAKLVLPYPPFDLFWRLYRDPSPR